MRNIIGLALVFVGLMLIQVPSEARSQYCQKNRYCPPVMPPGVRPPEVQVEILSMRGTGCPVGTAQASVSTDATTLSVLFDQFLTDIPALKAPFSEVKNCTIRLGFKFYGQYRIAVVGSDIRGFFSVPQGATSKVSVMHNSIFLNFKDRDKMNFTQNLNGPTEGQLQMDSRFSDNTLWSYCGSQTGGRAMEFMNIDINVQSQNLSGLGDLLVGVDSIDFNGNAALKYHLVWAYDTKNCPR